MSLMNHMKYDIESYDITRFKSADSGARYGFRVSDDLLVAVATPSNNDKFRIFSFETGKPVIKVNFISLQDAICFAEFLAEQMTEFLPILTVYPEADIPTLVQYTIPNGLAINKFIKKLEEDQHRKWAMTDMFSVAKGLANEPVG